MGRKSHLGAGVSSLQDEAEVVLGSFGVGELMGDRATAMREDMAAKERSDTPNHHTCG
jgi:hypothetical protein